METQTNNEFPTGCYWCQMAVGAGVHSGENADSKLRSLTITSTMNI